MITLDELQLPDHLVWVDEFDWTPVEQNLSWTLTGSLVVDQGVRQAGRPIPLTTREGGDWASRPLIDQLWAKVEANPTMTLQLHDGRIFQVRWRHQDTPIEAVPLADIANPDASTIYRLTLRFVTV